jgi:formate hydrogenlyase subunit 6/NADH:ubiquinone oxidoreductase subunit I
MKDGKPQIRKSDCIRCFCCQEFCPVGAMKVHRTLIAKLLT